MTAQTATMESIGSFKKILSISAIVYRFTMILFMLSCMIFFYKTYKYNVGIFHLQKQLNARFSVEDNYNGALVNIEYTDENILKESKMDHPAIEREASIRVFAFNFLERIFDVKKDTYVYDKETEKLLQVIPAKNNIFQSALVGLRELTSPKDCILFDFAIDTAMKEVKREQDRRAYAWYIQQKLKKEREEAAKAKTLIENEDEYSTNTIDSDFKLKDKDGGGMEVGLQ